VAWRACRLAACFHHPISSWRCINHYLSARYHCPPLNLVVALRFVSSCCAAILSQPPVINMETARDEAKMVLFGAAEEVLRATGTKPQAVDILIVNCSLFNPTPSLSGAQPAAHCRSVQRSKQVAGCSSPKTYHSSFTAPPCPAPPAFSLPSPPLLPPLAAMIVNHFKMRTNVMTYNLAGMGCSAGVIAIGLAQQLLQVGLPSFFPCRV
jgi:3-ketoacyl-CoA synthase